MLIAEEKYIYMLILESLLACQKSFKKCKKTYFRKVLVNFVMINKHQLLISSTKFNSEETKGKKVNIYSRNHKKKTQKQPI